MPRFLSVEPSMLSFRYPPGGGIHLTKMDMEVMVLVRAFLESKLNSVAREMAKSIEMWFVLLLKVLSFLLS